MKLRTLAMYLVAAALVCLVSGLSAKADIINFEDQPAGPSVFGASPPETLTYITSSGPLTITGGTILTKTTFLPADQTNVYGTASFGPGLSNTITLAFTSPINNFFFDLLNGLLTTQNYTVSDNIGNSQTFSIVPNLSLGLQFVTFPTVGQTVTITCSSCGTEWDFFIDNVGFNQPTPTVPEPGSMTLLGLGILGLAAVKLTKK